MGNAQAISYVYPWEWINGPSGAGDYDDAGFIPSGLTYPPQNSWNEALNYGGSAHMRTIVPGNSNGLKSVDWGVTEGLLTGFGTLAAAGPVKLYDMGDGLPPGNTFAPGAFASVKNQPQPYTKWKYNPNVPASMNVCTPATFPNCDMTSMLEGGGEASFFDHKTQTAGRIYAESLDRAYNKAFVSGGIEALRQVNTYEHSTFDPCSQPGFLELLIPLAAGVASVAVFEYYGKPEVTIAAGQQAATLVSVCLFGFVFNYTTGLLEYFNEPTNKHFQRAARFLLYPIGAYGGMLAGDALYEQTSQTAPQNYYQAGGALLGISVLEHTMVVPIARALSSGGALAGILLGTFGFLMRSISTLWCRLTTNPDSCSAMDDTTMQDSRRWDAVSITAMLTLEVCEREGWQKDDPHAQFVFQGLLSGPAMLMAPIPDPNTATTKWDLTIANPLGYTYAGLWQQEGLWNTVSGKFDAAFQRSQNVVGWDGDVSGLADIGNSNLYSCENWDIMREGLQTKSHPLTKHLKANFDAWVGNWKTPEEVGILVQKANNPANIEAMKHIPGWELEDAASLYTPLKVLAPELTAPNKRLDPPPPHEVEHLEVLPFYLDYPAVQLGLQAPYKRLDVPPPHQRPPTLEVLPFVEINDCAVTWRDDIMSGSTRWASFTPQQVQAAIEDVLAAPNCRSCDVEDRGKLEALRLALSASQSLTCTQYTDILQKFGWSPGVVQHAVYTVARTLDCGIPALHSWTQGFLADCTNYEQQGLGFATLPSSITDKWCT